MSTIQNIPTPSVIWTDHDGAPARVLKRSPAAALKRLAPVHRNAFVLVAPPRVLECVGIKGGDFVVVDETAKPTNFCVVAVRAAKAIHLRVFSSASGKRASLHLPGDPLARWFLTNQPDVQILGVATHVVHNLQVQGIPR